MNRLEQKFQQSQETKRKLLVPFITAGDSSPDVTVPLMHEMVTAGADVIELGIPFSDPMAEGPVIQKANERALEHHVSLQDVLEMVKAFRSQNSETPVVLMGYLNPIEVTGYDSFAAAAAQAGVDGVITVDMPPEEAGDYLQAFEKYQLAPVFLLSPTSQDQRIEKICAASRGFVYYVSLKGVTGAGHLDVTEVKEKFMHIREMTDLPIGVGFGIKDGHSAARIAEFADAVIVGSAIVSRIAEYAATPSQIAPAVIALIREIREGIDHPQKFLSENNS